MSDFWNQKYNTKNFLYGIEPNAFFKSEIVKLRPGNVLLPAEGQNGTSAALNGWQVTTFDVSNVMG